MSCPARLLSTLLFWVLLAQCGPAVPPPAESLPPLGVDPFLGLDPLGTDAEQAFTFRKGPAPPPRVGETVTLPFPPPAPAGKAAVKGQAPVPGPLRVLRTQPSGSVGLSSAVTASFDQPMVPVAALSDLSGRAVPLVLDPLPRGRFRWLGTQTVTFEPEGRLPFGTAFSAHVPAGTRSATGGVLEQEVRWTFATPRPHLEQVLPYRGDRQVLPDGALAFLFNQAVSGQKVLSLLRMNGRTGADFELVPAASWPGLKGMGETLASWDPERTVVVRPLKPLDLATQYSPVLDAGLCGEGPLCSDRQIHHYFYTYSPLKVEEIRCSDTRCDPYSGFYARMNNPLATEDVAPYVKVTPAPEDLEVRLSGSSLSISGQFPPRSQVTVEVLPGLLDIHQQKLAQGSSRELTTGDLYPQLALPARGHAVMELGGDRKVPLEVVSVGKTRMRLVRVAREQLLKVIDLARYSWDDDGRRDPLKGIKGLVATRTLSTGVGLNRRARLGLSTDEGLGKNAPGVLYIELRCDELRRHYRWANPFLGLVVSVTDIGLLARYDHDRILAMATGLESGAPLPGAELELRDAAGKVVWQGRTGADGTAELPGRRQIKERPPYVLWAARGKDAAFAILDSAGAGGGSTYISSYNSYGYAPAQKRLKLFLFTDRDPYRPGETVRLSGVLRMEDVTPTGGIEALEGGGSVKVVVTSPRGNKVLEKADVKVSPGGAFSLDVPLPAEADLGSYRAFVQTDAGNSFGSFQVQAYRAPEFAVKVEGGDGDLFLGDTLQARVGADYLFGAPMSGARASWTLRRQGSSFRPPGNEGFSFGEQLPYWLSWGYADGLRDWRAGGYLEQVGAAGSIVKSGQGVLDRKGRLELSLALEPEDPGVGKGKGKAEKPAAYPPRSFTLEAQVEDQNRQTIANRKVYVAHPASLYVGLRPDRTVVKAGEALSVSAVLADLKGARTAGRSLTVRALEVKNKMIPRRSAQGWRYEWESSEVEVGVCALTTAAEPASCLLTLPRPGAFLLRAETTDDRGRLARTTLQVYAHGPGFVPWRLENQSRVELVPDRDRYSPGDTARVLVKSPLQQSVGFLTVSRGGMASHRVLRMEGNAQVVEVPIPASAVPELHVGVALSRGRLRAGDLGDAARDLGRPTFAHGQVTLPVSSKERQVQVTLATDRQAVRPSGSFTLTLDTRDQAGAGVPGEVAVMVVDEGVLSLLDYKTPDPLGFFWSSRPAETGLQDNRDALLKREVDLKAAPRPHAGNGGGDNGRRRNGAKSALLRNTILGGAAMPIAEKRYSLSDAPPAAPASRSPDTSGAEPGGGGGSPPRIRSRSLFATTAYFNPSVITDEKGRARVEIKMPDDLTTFRIMAVALDRGRPDRFGSGEAQVKVRKPLLLRPSLPRFLSVGDRFEAAVMVHNETDAGAAVDVLVRGRNVRAAGETRRRVTLAAHEATEVRFSMEPLAPGPARLQFAAVLAAAAGAPPETDAVEKQVPVLLPVTTEAFATYGATDGSVAQPIAPPGDALPGYGGLELSLSSTALTGLQDAVRYLQDYPFECTEQRASRLLPIFGLKDILKDFGIGQLSDLELQKKLAAQGVKKLLESQRYDGGWGMWEGSRLSDPYLTAYALFTLLRARENGHALEKYRLDRAAGLLRRILDHPRKELGEQYAYTTQVLSVWALSDLGQHRRDHLARLYGLRDKLPLFARAMLMQATFRADGLSEPVKELARDLDNRAVESASAVHFSEVATESLRLLMHSEDRTDAIALYALLEVAPGHALIPKLARGLIQARVKGRWSTTQANAFALTALARYYKQVEKTVPDYVARLWLGEEGFLGEAAFKGRQLRVVQQSVPLAALQAAGPGDLLLAKQGPGKLYYRIGLRYAPAKMVLAPEEQGFSLTRVYEPLEGEAGTVRQDKDGAWVVKAGSTVRVRLTVVVPDPRYFVAVLDPLPAGLEGINLGFATSAQSALGNQLKGRAYNFYSWYALFAFDHREMRDESVVLFADRLPSGVYEYTYLARATTPGRFVAGPTRAEEMYQPETFGRTGTDVVVVE